MKTKSKNFIKKYYPCILFIIYIIFIHSRMLTTYGDDIWFANFKGKPLLDIMINRYMNWTSRFILDTCLFIFNGLNKYIWFIIDIFMWILCYIEINKMINKENKTKLSLILALIIILYPTIDMGSSGWVTTTIVYIWPLALGLYAFNKLSKIYNNNKLKIYEIILFVISLIVASNQEQVCLLLAGFTFVFLVDTYYKKKEVNKGLLGVMILLILMLLNHLLCPGNAVRLDISVKTSFPDYNKLNLIEKMGLSLNNTYEMILGIRNYIYLAFVIILTIFNYGKNKNYINVVIGLILIVSAIVLPQLNIFNLSSNYGGYLCPTGKNCLKVLPLIGFNTKTYLISLLVSIISIAGVIYLLFNTYIKDKNMRLFMPITFLAALLSRFIVGFSPTLFISGYRTGIFMYFIFIILIIKMIKDMKLKDKDYYKFLSNVTFLIFVMYMINYTIKFI